MRGFNFVQKKTPTDSARRYPLSVQKSSTVYGTSLFGPFATVPIPFMAQKGDLLE